MNKIVTEKLNINVIVYLDNIFVYIKDPNQLHIDAICWILKMLWKNSLYDNMKKCRFYQDEVCFLDFAVSVQGIRISK